MAQGKTETKNVVVNNVKAVVVSKVLEQNVIGGVLKPDENDVNPGVNTRTM